MPPVPIEPPRIGRIVAIIAALVAVPVVLAVLGAPRVVVLPVILVTAIAIKKSKLDHYRRGNHRPTGSP